MNGFNDLKMGVRIFSMIQEANVFETVTLDHRLTLRMMSDELNINKETIRQILHEHLRKRKISTKFVQHNLTDKQKLRRLTPCQDFIQTCEGNPTFLDCIVTGDESWLFQYDPETKSQSMQWTSKSSPRPKIFVCKRPRSILC
jgi:hypothetical protein